MNVHHCGATDLNIPILQSLGVDHFEYRMNIVLGYPGNGTDEINCLNKF